MGKDLATLEPLPGELLLGAGEGLPQVEGKQFRPQTVRELLDDPGGTIAPAKGVGQEMDLDHGCYHIVRILPDRLPLPVQGILGGSGTVPEKVRLPDQHRFHVVDIFQLAAQLFAHAARILGRVVRRPALLPFHTPSHGLKRPGGLVPIFAPAFPRLIVVRNRRQPPADLIGVPPSKARGDPHHLQVRHGTDLVDGAFGRVIETPENGRDHLLADIFQQFLDEDHLASRSSLPCPAR